MIKDANKYQVYQIFSEEDTIQYQIPKYQREYMWTQQYWEQLIKDLLENNVGYFLGPIICINREKDALKNPRPMEIIDGQQRLTSITLIFAALYNRFMKEDSSKDIELDLEKYKLRYRLTQKRDDIKGQLKLCLSTQNLNLEVFEWILNELGIYNPSKPKRPSQLGNRRLYKAYQYFKNTILDLDDLKEVKDFLLKVNQAWFVKIEVENHSDAFMLFESLNNRGMPLTPMDLIKNKLLAQVEKSKGGNINKVFETWQVILDNLNDYETQQRFLRQYYNTFRFDDRIRLKGIPKATKSNLIKIYDNFIKNDYEYALKEFLQKSEIYRQFIDLDFEESPKGLVDNFKDLLNIGGAPSRTLLLYLFSELKTETKLIKEVIEFLIKYFVRRNLSDYPGTRKLDQIFIDLIEHCEINKDNLEKNIIVDFLTRPDKCINENKFRELLEGDIYETNIQVTRFILTKIEESQFTDETKRDLWEKKGKKLAWSIEHILPQKGKLNKSWINMIAKGDKEKAHQLQGEYTHKIGNLSLTRYNPNLSTSDFNTKRDKSDRDGKPIGFRNGLFLNRDIAKKDEWTIENIKTRSKELIEKATELFKF